MSHVRIVRCPFDWTRDAPELARTTAVPDRTTVGTTRVHVDPLPEEKKSWVV